VRSSPRISRTALTTYEAIERLWQPLERLRRPPWD
jgi:hypothetical protein